MSIQNSVSRKGVFTNREQQKHQVSMPVWLYNSSLGAELIDSGLEENIATTHGLKFRHSHTLFCEQENYQHLSNIGGSDVITMMCGNNKYCGRIFTVLDVSETEPSELHTYVGLAEFNDETVIFSTNEIVEVGEEYRLDHGSFDTTHPCQTRQKFTSVEKVSNR